MTPPFTHEYCPNGNNYGIIDNIWGKKTFFEFDLAGRVNGVLVSDSDTNNPRAYESIRYTDGKGTVESAAHSMFDANGAKLRTIEYSYEYGDPALGQMPDVLYSGIFGGRSFNFTYDSLGRLTSRSISFNGGAKSETYTYKAKDANYTTTLVESMTDFSGVFHTYVYDANGNIIEESVGDQTIRYEYDSQNRLTRCFDPIAGSTTIYVYDDRGNILKVREADYMTEEELDAYYAEYGDAIFTDTAYTYGDSTWADLLTACNGVSITYDELGNPLTWYSGRNTTMTWENGRQLVQFANATSQYDFEYNADGLRTKKTVTNKRNSKVTKSTEYYIVNGQYVGEVSTIGENTYVISYVYDENGSPAGINVRASNEPDVKTYYFAKNLQGDIIAILNEQGNIEAKYVYNAWGDLKSVKDANGNTITSSTHVALLNPFRYRGYMYDSETGFYYLRSRYYSPDIGRFINSDGLVSNGQGFDGFNMFTYCGNNPIVYTDQSGCFFVTIIGFVVTVAATITITKMTKEALKKSNQVNNARIDNDKSTTTHNIIINNQKKAPITDFNYGVRPANKNGCEAIAIHNAKVLEGVDSTLTDTFADIQDHNGMWLFGIFGTYPHIADDVIEDSGLNCTLVNLSEMTAPGTYIISYWNEPIRDGIHTVAISYNGYEYTVYNTCKNCRDGEFATCDTLDEFKKGFICGYHIWG